MSTVAIPVRIQRRRTKGFDLQAASRAVNGLPVVYIGRNGSKTHPNVFANQYKLGDVAYLGYDVGRVRLQTMEEVVRAFEINQLPSLGPYLPDIEGKNLACWCKVDTPWCHGNPLLRAANPEIASLMRMAFTT